MLFRSSCIVADTNLHADTLSWLMGLCKKENIKLFIETVSIAKSQKLKRDNLDGIFMLTPNEDELFALTGLKGEEAAKSLLQKGVKHVWVKMGGSGSVLYYEDQSIHLSAPVVEPIDTTGAGDATLAGFIYAHVHQKDIKACMAYGHALAAGVLMQNGTVIETLNQTFIEQLKQQFYPNVP